MAKLATVKICTPSGVRRRSNEVTATCINVDTPTLPRVCVNVDICDGNVHAPFRRPRQKSSIGQCLLGRRNCARTLLSRMSSSTRTRKRVGVSTLMHVAVRFSPTTLPNRAAKRDAATQPGALEQPAFGSTSSAYLVRQLYQIVLPNAVAATP